MEPTLDEILEMEKGNQELIAKFLPFLLLLAKCDITARPQHEAARERFEAFKAKIKDRHLMTNDGAGI
jgi:hypothetical protein